ncbi:thiamine biosynthesis protein ThiI [Litorivivens lipolytica]|uniref:tRNA sulfurtransferase n=1 Tax=Litorivivens lipolytica TaxID=1524264 RepID=A0A7W4W7W1_9GAMM|nr:tRNA uracil 4-sulfurtransferase ThiI [Litorivivens lipolytica]MBB3048477.1 thiamine biosynthesis protein ThiI [Litorivivens lipolytica]
MKFIVKFFPEITIKSRPVRKQFVKQLHTNVKRLLQPLDPEVHVAREWDKMVVATRSTDPETLASFVEVLRNTPGIAYFMDVAEYPLVSIDDIYQKTLALWAERLAGKRFSVRCKRTGTHDFQSLDVERYVGGGLNQHTDAAGVDLANPEVVVRIEVRDETVFVVNQRYPGLGGFPLGSLDPVLSLISGGFDSPVASYLMMKRGLRTHFCFFNLGGRDHEIGVKEVALYLWMKYGASHRVKFVTVPFEDVVGEILKNVDNSQMGVVLKRMMLRAAEKVADELNVQALVTGEAIAQVSSQTLTNLSVIDAVTDKLVLRPLIAADKGDIIRTAAEIGTEEFAANMPEYCGVISVKPTTKARPERVAEQEAKFDFAVLEAALAKARYTTIDELANEELERIEVEVLPVPLPDAIVLDVRHPDEAERSPLKLAGVTVQNLPFYELHSKSSELSSDITYLLYCDKGVMSRLHAAHLVEQGFANIKVYRPA